MSVYVSKRSEAVSSTGRCRPAQPQSSQHPAKLQPLLASSRAGTLVAFEAAYGWGWLTDWTAHHLGG